MTPFDKIRITDLLMQREKAWIKIWECEQGIGRILDGASYPFLVPLPLPSFKKAQKPSGKTSKITLRRLRTPQENAYRLIYEFENKIEETLQVDTELIRTLLNSPIETFKILSIETVKFEGNELLEPECIETLFKRNS